ncbi:MAG: membrane-anchored protein YejM (alkaline phosphatase superfamily) [Planctomycetota bacterium]|jgi:membrane-anchored protein YejM (alkaline phosphatase superfamily)
MNPPSLAVQRQATFQLWLVNLVLGISVGSLWLAYAPADMSLHARGYMLLALVSSVATIALVPGLIFFAVQHSVRNWRIVGWILGFTGAWFLALLYTDTIIYRLLRYHFNSAVLNVMFTRGSGDAVVLGPKVWLLASSVIGLLTVLQRGVWTRTLRQLTEKERVGSQPRFLLRPRVVCMAVLLPVIFIEKGVYAHAEVTRDLEIQQVARPFPLYPRVRLSEILDPDGLRPPKYQLLPEDAAIIYPRSEPKWLEQAEPKRPNVLLLVIDSWRKDMFSPEMTPELTHWAKDARVFDDHLSGGNGTRFGVFAMLYGLHGSYWFPVLEARRSPVLLDSLQSFGYEMQVFSAASMNFPEFRDTAWVNFQENVHDDYPEEFSHQRDQRVADDVASFFADRSTRSQRDPFFCFVLIDAPHQPYHNPGGPFEPTVEKLDYIELATTTDPELVEKVFNRYKNSVLHADKTAGRVLQALHDSGLDDETLVIITGDHGEEFQECGYWGHTSNFTPEQLEVPFLVRGPGVEPGLESRATSHLDVPGTLMEMLGADPASRPGYALGADLFDPPQDRRRVVSGWSDIGLWSPNGIFRVPLLDQVGEVEAYDENWQLLPDTEARCRAEMAALERMAEECLRFLQVP